MSDNRFQDGTARITQLQRKRQVRAAQVHLLYDNANTGTWVTVLVASLLAFFQWRVIPHPTTLSWLAFMMLVTVGRLLLIRLYRRVSPTYTDVARWDVAFAVGTGLAGVVWGAAAIL